jgi:hypothetical protein
MIGPEPFKISAPEGEYYVNFEIDMYSLSFPIVCHSFSLKREIIKHLKIKPDERNHVVNAMLIEKNEAVNTHDVLPLLVTINFIPKGEIIPEEEEQDKAERVYQFRQFIDQLTANGELDYLYYDKE